MRDEDVVGLIVVGGFVLAVGACLWPGRRSRNVTHRGDHDHE